MVAGIIARVTAAAFFAIAILAAPATSGAGESARPFAVKDSIEITRLVDPNPAWIAFFEPRFKLSPDGSKFAVVLRRGNLATGANDYSLVLFDVAEVLTFANSAEGRPLPRQDVLLKMSSDTRLAWYEPAIDQIAWLPDSRALAFVARDRRASGQVCVINLATRSVEKLTPERRDVASFAMSQNPRTLVYAAWTTPDWNHRNIHGYVVGAEHISTLLSTDPTETWTRSLRYFAMSVPSAMERDLSASAGLRPGGASIADDGRKAIVYALVERIPARWFEYDFIKTRSGDVDPAPVYQALLVDLASGAAEPLIDAPIDPLTFRPPTWSRDGRSVSFESSYLPLDVEDATERERRRRYPGRVRVDLATKKVSEAAATTHTLESPRVRISVKQSIDTPPEIQIEDVRTGRQRVITDLNPQLRSVTLGTGRVFQWTDRRGNPYTGGLVLPPNYIEGKRYPVVLQTHGFNEREFLVDGPNGTTSIYAAQALANRGLVVLQMPDPEMMATNEHVPHENSAFVAMMEGAIDALSDRGIADRTRVGISGFSRAGMHVQYAVTFSTYPVAAAIIADAIAATPLSYTLRFGDGMLEWESRHAFRAPFFGDGMEQWLARSPIFHLDRIRTPIRYEFHGTAGPPDHWDAFAILKRVGRPVEMIHIPFASHVVEQPHGRFTSQQGAVDWFAFWLLNHEDSTPDKEEQYRRWRVLRESASLARVCTSLERPIGPEGGRFCSCLKPASNGRLGCEAIAADTIEPRSGPDLRTDYPLKQSN